MTTHAFVALGFDPTPGSPDALEGLGRDCGQLADLLDDDAARVQQLLHGQVWAGAAADAFRHRLDDLPRDLQRAGDAYQQASAALARFSGALLQGQLRARVLEQRAEACVREVDHLAQTCADGDPRVRAADQALDEVRSGAEQLRDQVRAEAALCSRLLHDATRHAPHAPGWFHRLVDSGLHALAEVNQAVGDFVRAHAEDIAAFADVMSKVSSVLSVVAMLAAPIPVLGTAIASAAGTGALVAAGLALAGHSLVAIYAGGSWATVAFDAAAVASGAGPRGVEAVAGRIATAKGLELEATSMTTVEALSTLRHPTQALADSARAEMTMPQLVTRVTSYQLELTSGALGIIDLGGGSPAEPAWS